MHAFINIALRAGRDAAEVLAQYSDRPDRVMVLDDTPGSLITSAHKDADRTILFHLQKAYPQHSYTSRVSGHQKGGDGQPLWLVDPLIGGHNFLRGFPAFALSIACVVDGKLAHGVLIDPLQDEEFSASRGGGALLNNRRLRVSQQDTLEGAMLGLAGSAGAIAGEATAGMITRLATVGASWRITGCTGLDLVHTAAGRLDGGWLPNPGRLSIAAAALILQEAGGLVSDENGNPECMDSGQLMFGNPRFFKQLLKFGRQP